MKLGLESPGSMIMHKDQNEIRKAKSVQRDNPGALALNSAMTNNAPQIFNEETVDLEKIFLDEIKESGKKHEQDTAGGAIMKQSGKESSLKIALNPLIDRFDTTDSAKKLTKQQDDQSPRFMIDGG